MPRTWELKDDKMTKKSHQREYIKNTKFIPSEPASSPPKKKAKHRIPRLRATKLATSMAQQAPPAPNLVGFQVASDPAGWLELKGI